MNTKPNLCDDRQLLLMLQSEDSAEDNTSFLNHVEHCVQCQQRLEQLAADSDHWNKASDALSSESEDTLIGLPHQILTSSNFSGWLENPSTWTEDISRLLLSPPSHPEMLGRLGRYEVERMIGAGGMGVVFKAFDSELNRPVAIKVLAPFLIGSGSARKRFSREARAAAAIVHEHVVPIYNVETERDAPFLVMQFIAGESLQQRIDRTGPMQCCEVLRLGMQIASGLSAAHQQGLVHRDIKPSNILLDQGVDRALISDFGLARAIDDAELTRSGIHPGTPQFMSPEQAGGESVDIRSDLFSLGSVLYTMCTGRPPFRAESSLGVLRRIADDEPRRIREINPAIPEWMCGIIGKLMAKQPSDRFQNAGQVAELCEQCLAHIQQPEFSPLPAEAQRLAATVRRDDSAQHFWKKAPSQMLKVGISVIAIAVLIMAAFWQRNIDPAGLTALQGEWTLVAREQDGQAVLPDQFFNERLVISGTSFQRPQTAPNGTEIKGETGKLSLVQGHPENLIEISFWGGTVYGIYQIEGDQLRICVTRNGGGRPDRFTTGPGDDRVLSTYRRIKQAGQQTEPQDDATAEWQQSWLDRISKELNGTITPHEAMQWMKDHGFTDIEAAPITLNIAQRIHPDMTQTSLDREGLNSVISGVLSRQPTESTPNNQHLLTIQVYCVFDTDNHLKLIHAGPQIKSPQEPDSETPSPNANNPYHGPDQSLYQRTSTPISQPQVARNATVVTCLGPLYPVRLGELVSLSSLSNTGDPGVVCLHVWDWSKSDVSRVMLLQQSEIGVLSDDGSSMLTSQGEEIQLSSKRTRQYSGFSVQEGDEIQKLWLSPSRLFAAVRIVNSGSSSTSPESQSVSEPAPNCRLRLIRLHAASNKGQIIDEYPADSQTPVVFSDDEHSVFYATEDRKVVQRDLAAGNHLRSFQPDSEFSECIGLAVSSQNQSIAMATSGGTVHVWDVESATQTLKYSPLLANGEPDPYFKATILRFSPGQRQLMMISQNKIRIVDSMTAEVLRETTDAQLPHFLEARWAPNSDDITLVTAAQRSETRHVSTTAAGTSESIDNIAERLPQIYRWPAESNSPIPDSQISSASSVESWLDPDIEARRLTGIWRIVDRTMAGTEQTLEIGQTFQILHTRMGEAQLKLNPNSNPRTVDIIFREGPNRGKVVKGIYEWLPHWTTNKIAQTENTGEALRICTFIHPNPDDPDARPPGFQPAANVDTAVWECVTHQLTPASREPATTAPIPEQNEDSP